MTHKELLEYQREYRRRKLEEKRKMRDEMYKDFGENSDEEFMELKELPGYYAGSNGTIVSLKGYKGPKVLAKRETKYGYMLVMLSIDGYPKSFQVARLVLSAFEGYPADPWLCYVYHKDGDLRNCRLDNIEWLVCETDETYDPSKSHRRGVLKPEDTKARMTMAKYNQSRETIEKAIATRKRHLKERGYWR